MNTQENSERIRIPLQKVPTKGDMVATEVFGTTVRMWFQSPTGDSSDVQISDLQCNSHGQAVDIANRHNEMWNIDTRHYRMADFKHPPEGIKPIW